MSPTRPKPFAFRRPHAFPAIVAMLLSAALLGACATPSIPAAAKADPVDLTRYMGRWYVIAHVPYFAERGHVASSDTYTLDDDGGIAVHYTYRTGFSQPEKSVDSTATVVEGTGNRLWKQRFFHLIPAKYRILEVAPDYSWTLVDYPGRDLAWILARSPDMEQTQYAELLDRMERHGVNSDKLWRVPQTADQVGELGFDRPNDP